MADPATLAPGEIPEGHDANYFVDQLNTRRQQLRFLDAELAVARERVKSVKGAREEAMAEFFGFYDSWTKSLPLFDRAPPVDAYKDVSLREALTEKGIPEFTIELLEAA